METLFYQNRQKKKKKLLSIFSMTAFFLFLGACQLETLSPQKKITASPQAEEEKTFPLRQENEEIKSKESSTSPEILSSKENSSSLTEPKAEDKKPFDEISFLHFSSWEANFLPVYADSDKEKTSPLGGLENLISLVKKHQNKATFLYSTGNFLPGDINDRRPAIEALNLMGLKATAVGVFELNYGIEKLKEKLSKAQFDVLSANLYQGDKRVFSPYAIYELGGIKVAVIGLIHQKAATEVAPQFVKDLVFKDPSGELRKILPEVQKQADVITLLTDFRYGKDRKIAEEFPQIDLIISRYNRTLKSRVESFDSVMVVRTSQKKGVELGKVFLYRDTENFRVIDNLFFEVSPEELELQSLKPDKTALLLIKNWQKDEQERSEVLCQSQTLLSADYGKIRQEEAKIGNLITDIMLYKRPDAQISLFNSGGIRSSLPAGEITYGMVSDVLPYKNYLVEISLTGSVLREALENSVARYQELSGSFLQVGGISFSFDPMAEQFYRVKDVFVQGEPLDENRTYKVVTVDYLASGGDDFLMFKDKPVSFSSQKLFIEIVKNYLLRTKNINPRVEGRITVLR